MRHALLLLAICSGAQAQSVCSSDAAPRPVAVLERFINADCESCWPDAKTPRAGPREIALDWVLPGGKGEDAALSAVASTDGVARLEALGRKVPLVSDAARSRVQPTPHRLRVAQGMPINDYIGTSIELEPGRGGPWRAWLVLVESLPAGTEGSPVERNLVRNVFQPAWDLGRPPAGRAGLSELRPMQIREGVQPSRLRLVALLEDARGRLRAIATSVCRPGGARP